MRLHTREDKLIKLKKLIDKVQRLFAINKEIWCPYFESHVHLNADGMNHLLYRHDRAPRNIEEQILKLGLVSRALNVIANTGTLQELRDKVEKTGSPAKDGFYKTKHVRYWGFHAIVGDISMIKIVVVIKRVGDGKLLFWSVLPHRKFNNQKLYDEGIDED